MNCPTCTAVLPDDAAFCGQCGNALRSGKACARCGKANAPEMRFCLGCGAPLSPAAFDQAPRTYTPKHLAEKILTSRAALEGERKQVTVLFADVKGSMELAEQVDPEAWHGILDRFFTILADGVHRFEGTVNQYTGDGIMALFGAPIAHEDHAQRACWAALHLRDEVRRYADELRTQRGLIFAVRLGLNSGDVVVGKIGDDLRMDYTALGHTVGLAQRMEQLAEPGRPLLTEDTAKLVTGFFALRDLGPSRVKGASAPLRLYELEGPGQLRTRFDLSRTRGLSRFVGRVDEIAVLESALERTLAGSGLVVGIVAEPGVGKSRLCYEFVERCRARGISVIQGHGVPHGKVIPLLPWLEIHRGRFGITEQDSDETARNKIAGFMLRADAELAGSVSVMFEFLGVPDPREPAVHLSPEAMQREITEITKRLIVARARRNESGVVLFEDLHWFDAASEKAQAAVLDAIPPTGGSLVLCTFRPGYRAAWMEKPFYRELPLRPLGPDAIVDLLRDLLGSDPSVAGLADHVRERTGGNPFFIEEVVQALVEGGSLAGARGAFRLVRPVDELAIPPTVQALLAARMDRLPEREKAVLQAAAVVGREVPEPVLQRVVELPPIELDATVQHLVAREFLHETALYPEREYAFKHPLTQEVAYRSQLAERRARVHATVARAFEELHRDKLDERAALLAYHWEHAGEARRAAEWHRRAADWIGSRDRAEMLRHWRKVRTLLATVPESPETLSLGVQACRNIIYSSNLLGIWDDEMPAVFAEGRALAERLGDPGVLVRLLNSYGGAILAMGAGREALPHLRESVRVADESGRPFLRFIARLPLSNFLRSAGSLREALALNEEADALVEGSHELDAEIGASPYAFLLANRAQLLTYLGRFEEAGRVAQTGLDVARARGDKGNLGAAHRGCCVLSAMIGDGARALHHGRQMVESTEADGTPFGRTFALLTLGRAQLATGQWGDAADTAGAALALMRERRTALLAEASILATLAEAYLGTGDASRALETSELALAAGRRLAMRLFQIPVLLARARVLLATAGADGAAEIDATLSEAAALVSATEAHAYTPFIHIERARLARLTGDEAGRARELREAHRLFSAMDAPIRAEQLARELA